jgi:hypothetical protein
VAAVNRVGTDGKGFAYTGDSQVLDFQGESLLSAGEADGVFQVCWTRRSWRRIARGFRRIWMPILSSLSDGKPIAGQAPPHRNGAPEG